MMEAFFRCECERDWVCVVVSTFYYASLVTNVVLHLKLVYLTNDYAKSRCNTLRVDFDCVFTIHDSSNMKQFS